MRERGGWSMLFMVVLGAAGLSAWLIYADLPGWANALMNALAGLILVVVLLAAPSGNFFSENGPGKERGHRAL